MSVIKSLSVDRGDMFYIDHNSDNFTIIDCYYRDEYQRDVNFGTIKTLASEKFITRFISTHPDDDHIGGLDELDDLIGILNFYVVENEATKDEETEAFKRYKKLRDDKKKAFYVYKGCSRKWMNRDSEKDDEKQNKSSGINFLWPDTNNKDFKEVLEAVKAGESPNNISPIFTYTQTNGIKVMWMGDLETEFLDKIKKDVDWPKIDVLFAPHHGRKSGHVSADVLELLSPKIIVLGEAPSKDLDYYNDYETIKQNHAGDVTFVCEGSKVRVYVEKDYPYKVGCFYNENVRNGEHGKYLGTFTPYQAEK